MITSKRDNYVAWCRIKYDPNKDDTPIRDETQLKEYLRQTIAEELANQIIKDMKELKILTRYMVETDTYEVASFVEFI